MLASATRLMRNLKEQPAFLALTLTSALIAALCLAFDPCWETNDDVAMSMIAHGYGLAAYSSSHLVNSNVLWGYLVGAMPTINGVLGYSVATLAVLLVIGWAMLYSLLRLSAGYFTGLLAVALIMARPTLFPQFTINAGLLTAAAIIGWQVYARLGSIGNLVAACLLAFFGYLIRDKEFFLVLGVALPLLPWRALRERRQLQIALLLLCVAIALAAAFDRWSYSGPEWQHLIELRSPLSDLVDFGAGWRLEQHPEIMERHGYSQNDIELTKSWFFVDPHIADPKSLNAMLAELGPISMQEGGIQSGFTAITALNNPVLLPLILPAIFLLVLLPRWSVALAWVLCLAALFTIGVMGRPSLLRIHVPLMSLLLVAPLMVGKCKDGARQWVVVLTLFVACVGNAYVFTPQALVYKRWIQQVQRDIHGLPAGPIVVWGATFPFQSAFPVLANDPNLRDIKLYGLNGFTHAPFSVATAEQTAGRGMIERLRTDTGISVIASQGELELLRIYCMEHLNSQLRGAITYRTRWSTIWQVRCLNLSGNFR